MPVPSAPIINPQPRSSPGTIEFQWSPPETPGGTITGYFIEIWGAPDYTSFVYSISTIETARYIKIPVLGDGINYYCTIAATNDGGTSYGPVAKFRAPWQCGNKPGVPASVNSIYNGNGVYTVTWEPGADGGATIFWYVITPISRNPSGPAVQRISVSGYESSKTIQGLNPASTYIFLLQAVNCPGYSPGIISLPIPIQYLKGNGVTTGVPTWVATYGGNATLITTDPAGAAIGDGANAFLNGETGWEFPSLGLLTTYTVNVWFYNTNVDGNDIPIPYTGNPCLVTEEFNSSTDLGINFIISTNIPSNNGGLFACGFYNGGYHMGTTFSLPATANTWINIQYTWDGTNIITYINGASIGSVAPGTLPASSGKPIRIGQKWDAQQFMKGYISQVRIYPFVLTPEEVLGVYNKGIYGE
jgi:hypothetical protein